MGGGGMAPRSLLQDHTHTKENKMEANGAFSQTLIFFNIILYSILGPDAYSAVRGQHIRAKNIKDAKTFLGHFKNCNILYSTRA